MNAQAVASPTTEAPMLPSMAPLTEKPSATKPQTRITFATQ